MTKVLLMGTMPPPTGGVTIHIDRFLHYEQDMCHLAVLDIKKQTLFFRDKKIKSILGIVRYFLSTSIVHIHISNKTKIMMALVARIFFKKVVYTHHNSRIKNKIEWKLINMLSHKIILVNDKSIDKQMIHPKKTTIIPAFLPPQNMEKLPIYILDTLSKYDSIISTNCSIFTLYENKDLYGFDLIVDAFYNLCQTNKLDNTLLVLVDPSGTAKTHVETLTEKRDFGANEILYINEKIDFVSLLKMSSLTIRATRTDGDSISIRESLYFNVPIIASDVTWRPEGTIIFENENIEDLENKIFDTLKNKNKFKYDNENYAQKIIDLYKEILDV